MELYRRKIMKYDRPIIALDFPDKEKTFEFLKKFPEDEKLFVKVGWNFSIVKVLMWLKN